MFTRLLNVIFILFFFAIFYFGAYIYLSSRESSSWHYEYVKSTIKGHPDADTLILGDSTAGNDFRANFYNDHSEHKAVTLAMPGSWYFAQHKLADFAKHQNKNLTTVILLIGPDTFTSNRLKGDVRYCRNSLNLSDIYKTWLYRENFLSFVNSTAEIMFRPFLFQTDLQDLLCNFSDRTKLASENFHLLGRTGSSTDLFYEESSDHSVCNIGDLNQLQKQIDAFKAAGNKDQQTRYERIVASYESRMGDKSIAGTIPAAFDNLIRSLSGNFDRVYVLNSPTYSGFSDVYSSSYRKSVENLTKEVTKPFRNVTYIQLDPSILSDCSNFLDVVHMNSIGGEKVTKAVLSYTSHDQLKPKKLVSDVPMPMVKKIILKDFGPATVEANKPFNVQPNGASAVWATCENASPSTVVVINERRLKSVSHKGGNLVTAEVPADLVQKKGVLAFYLFDPRCNSKSNETILNVE